MTQHSVRTGDPSGSAHGFMPPVAVLSLLACMLPIVSVSSVTAQEPMPVVESSRLLVEGGGRVAFSARGDLLAYDRPDADGRYDIFVLDMATLSERCITCRIYDLRRTSNFNPTWQPSGESLVFQVQRNPRRLRIDALEMTTPNRAVHSDLFIMRADGSDYYQLTRAAEMGSAVLDPHFSYEGDRLIWSERVTSRGRGFGEWRLQSANVVTRRGIARLKGSRKYLPGKGVFIPHGFSPDEKKILLSGTREGQSEAGIDVFLLDLETEELQRLTHTSRGRESIARFAANGTNILFTAERPIDRRDVDLANAETLVLPGSEIWMMNLDGTEKRQITSFYEELGRVTVGDLAVSPDGEVIAVHLVFGGESPRQAIYLLRASPALHR